MESKEGAGARSRNWLRKREQTLGRGGLKVQQIRVIWVG